jgi:hypothetical protein
MAIGSSYFTATTTPAAISTGSVYAGGIVDLLVTITSGTVYLGGSTDMTTAAAQYTTADSQFTVRLPYGSGLYGFRATTGAMVRILDVGDV